MSEDESFLARWSRRKREAEAEGTSGIDEAATRVDPKAGPAQERSAVQPETAEPEPAKFEATALPKLEEISAETDISAFLRAGVPAELKQAALRRAWVADPSIREFVGLAENAFDFNAPNAIAGFGPLQATEQTLRMAREIVGERGPTASGPEATAERTQSHPSMPAASSKAPGADAGPHSTVADLQDSGTSAFASGRDCGSADALAESEPALIAAHQEPGESEGVLAPQAKADADAPRYADCADAPAVRRRRGGALPT